MWGGASLAVSGDTIVWHGFLPALTTESLGSLPNAPAMKDEARRSGGRKMRE